MSRLMILLFALFAMAIASKIEGRVVGGRQVSLGHAPYMASLRSLTNVHFCGGTILSINNVLTSATCTNGRGAATINIVVGSNILGAGGLTHRSNRITAHPGFNARTLANDIALVGTATTFPITPNIQFASLNAYPIDDGVSAESLGWGMVSDVETNPNNLHSIVTQTISNDDCRSYQKPEYASYITNNKICTPARLGRGCYGDEGGPLFANNQLIGVASWNSRCEDDVPNVYERVAPHRLWILSHIA